MHNFNDLNYFNIIGNQILIYGEINTGKTQFTADFVKFLIESEAIEPKKISILDFGPKFKFVKGFKIGGRIQDFYPKSLQCLNLHNQIEIIPPRLNARTKGELFNDICQNYHNTSRMLLEFNANPTDFLIVNDISIHLHLGKPDEILSAVKKSKTFLGNTYYGTSIMSKRFKLLSLLEKKKVDLLIKNIEFSVLSG